MNRTELATLIKDTYKSLYTEERIASMNEEHAYMFKRVHELTVKHGDIGNLPYQFENRYEDEANINAEFVSHLSPEQAKFYVWLQINPSQEIQDEFGSQYDVVEEAEQLESSKFYALFKEQA